MIHIYSHLIAQIFSQAAMLELNLAKHFGLHLFQFLALTLVGGAGGLSIKELRRRLSIPGSSLTFTIDSLEKKKLIRRRRSREDRRQWLLFLTPTGEKLCADILEMKSQAISPALDGLSGSEKTAFLKIAEELRRATDAKPGG